MVIGADQNNRDRLGAEDGETGLLVMKKGTSENRMRGAVAIGDNRLEMLQLRKARLGFIEIERRQQGISGRSDAQVVLQEEHLRDLPDVSGILAVQIHRIVG